MILRTNIPWKQGDEISFGAAKLRVISAATLCDVGNYLYEFYVENIAEIEPYEPHWPFK